jgi:membrane-associated phospholipid phosphatase
MNYDFLSSKKELNKKSIIWISTISIIYLLSSAFLIGFKFDQLFLVLLFNVFYYISSSTRKFILGFSIFIVFWVIFDSMKVIPNYKINSVHIEDLYLREKSLFGINEKNEILTPNEYADRHSSIQLDILAGLFYLNWVPIPLMFAFYLFRKNKLLFLQFSLSFLFVNLIGFVIYYIYPAAPPWYVKEYGFNFYLNTPGNTGALSRFDEFFGMNIFGGLYSKSSNVFAAMPSLHSSYPVIVMYYGLKSKIGWINIFFFIFMIGIWFSAVYSGHHYVQDVLAGIACAIIGLVVFQKILLKKGWFQNFIYSYLKKIA